MAISFVQISYSLQVNEQIGINENWLLLEQDFAANRPLQPHFHNESSCTQPLWNDRRGERSTVSWDVWSTFVGPGESHKLQRNLNQVFGPLRRR